MKNKINLFLLTIFFIMFSAPVLFAQDGSVENPIEYGSIFTTFTALVAIIPVLVELFKKLLGKTDATPNLAVQIFSWVIGIIVAVFGWLFNLGFLSGLEWYIAIAYGFAASLAANGVADTKIIEWLFSLFRPNKNK